MGFRRRVFRLTEQAHRDELDTLVAELQLSEDIINELETQGALGSWPAEQYCVVR